MATKQTKKELDAFKEGIKIGEQSSNQKFTDKISLYEKKIKALEDMVSILYSCVSDYAEEYNWSVAEEDSGCIDKWKRFCEIGTNGYNSARNTLERFQEIKQLYNDILDKERI